jgi:hypothetical protein
LRNLEIVGRRAIDRRFIATREFFVRDPCFLRARSLSACPLDLLSMEQVIEIHEFLPPPIAAFIAPSPGVRPRGAADRA